ncbi:MAG: vitamin B12-dependent ribonucleotide reductase, partial [Planctomycetota bacterium]
AILTPEPVVAAPAGERIVERIVERIIERPMRRRLPDTRESLTHKFNVAGHEGYLIVGLYEDRRPGELFITMAKEGSTIGGLMDSLGTAISVALQYGVPVESLVTKFAHQRFEPMGMTTNADIPFAKSLVDYIFRWLGMEFISGYREQNAPRRPSAGGESDGDYGKPVARIATDARTASIQNASSKEDGCTEDNCCEESAGWTAARRVVTTTSPTSSPNLMSGGSAGGSAGTMGTVSSRTVTTHAVSASVASTSEGRVVEAFTAVERSVRTVTGNALDQSNAALMGDAPACDGCGSITVRNGTCYRCLNCGNSMGCS